MFADDKNLFLEHMELRILFSIVNKELKKTHGGEGERRRKGERGRPGGKRAVGRENWSSPLTLFKNWAKVPKFGEKML